MPFDTASDATTGSARREVDFFKNTGGVAIAKGQPVIFDVAQTVPGDIGVSLANAAAENSLLVGIALEAMAVNAFGKVQRYGFIENVPVRQEAGQAISVGNVLKLNGAASEFIRSGAAAGLASEVVALEASGVGTALVTLNCFLRCL